jgi:membrane protease subunit HflC
MSRRTLVILAVVVAALGVLASSSLFTVHQAEQALVLQLGEPIRAESNPGLKFKIPFIQNVIFLDKRILAFDAPAEEVIASDQKRLVVDSFLRFRISDPLKFYQSVGNETVARSRLASILNSGVRKVLGQETFSTVLSGERVELMRQIQETVNKEAGEFGITVVDVRIKRADLPEANSQAIFRRMQTEREREAKEFRAQGAEISQRIRARADREKTVLLAEAEREAEILRGEGDAQVVKIFADAYGRDIDFFSFYRSMLAYREALGADETTMVLSPDSEFFRYFRDMSGAGKRRD